MTNEITKILVIDDEKMIRDLAEKILKKASYNVLLAEDGENGIEIFNKNMDSIKLLLIDLSMAGISGIETLQKIRAIVEDIPCIISSGNNYDQNDIPSNLNHDIYFLQKPYHAKQLSNMVNEILSTC
ncbi:MAG: response regulator [Candidatus Zixiibacteriota bacterium]